MPTTHHQASPGNVGWHGARATRIGLALTLVCNAALAQSPQASQRDVTFRSDSILLGGTVVSPAGAGRHPAIVFAHSSGPLTRDGTVEYARMFAQIGFVGLAYDKRGTGQSSGSWTAASPNDLTADALAAIALLKAQPNVDTTRIGIWGVSQAGWPAVRAAARSKDVAFLVLTSAGGVAPRESELYAYRSHFARLGTRADTVATAMTTLTMYFDYLDTGRGRVALDAAVERAASAPWNREIRLHEKMPSEGARASWQWLGSSAPEPIDSVRVPVLLMFGERDHEFPTKPRSPAQHGASPPGLQGAGRDSLGRYWPRWDR